MKQLIESDDCRTCHDKCCRFHPDLLEYSPIFTKDEYKKVVNTKNKRLFNPNKFDTFKFKFSSKENGYYTCPLLKNNWECSVYKDSPFYCKIWPFMLMKKKNKIYLVKDDVEDCPGVKKINKPLMKKYIKYLVNFIESDKIIKKLKKYPPLIKKYDSEFTKVFYLKKLTQSLNETP